MYIGLVFCDGQVSFNGSKEVAFFVAVLLSLWGQVYLLWAIKDSVLPLVHFDDFC